MVRVQLFADDVCVAPDTRLQGWQSCFQEALDALSEFAALWRLQFSLTGGKSAIVYFRRSNVSLLLEGARFPTRFVLSGGVLEVVDQYKYLGVQLQYSLNWDAHFQQLLRQARFAAFQTQRLLPRLLLSQGRQEAAMSAADRPVGGPHFSAVRALVMGGVYARCTYGCMFLSGPQVEAQMRQLQSILVRPLRQALGLPGNTHIVSVLVECDCPTLAIYRQQLLLSYARRVRTLDPAHPARMQLERSQQRLAMLAQPLLLPVLLPAYGCVVPFSLQRISGVDESRRPLLYDVLEAERRWNVRVLDGRESPTAEPQQVPRDSSTVVNKVAVPLSVATIEAEARRPTAGGAPAASPMPSADSEAGGAAGGKLRPSLGWRASSRIVSGWPTIPAEPCFARARATLVARNTCISSRAGPPCCAPVCASTAAGCSSRSIRAAWRCPRCVRIRRAVVPVPRSPSNTRSCVARDCALHGNDANDSCGPGPSCPFRCPYSWASCHMRHLRPWWRRGQRRNRPRALWRRCPRTTRPCLFISRRAACRGPNLRQRYHLNARQRASDLRVRCCTSLWVSSVRFSLPTPACYDLPGTLGRRPATFKPHPLSRRRACHGRVGAGAAARSAAPCHQLPARPRRARRAVPACAARRRRARRCSCARLAPGAVRPRSSAGHALHCRAGTLVCSVCFCALSPLPLPLPLLCCRSLLRRSALSRLPPRCCHGLPVSLCCLPRATRRRRP